MKNMVTKKAKPKTPRQKTEVTTEKVNDIGWKQWKNPAPNWVKIMIGVNSGVSIAVAAFVVATPLIKSEYKDLVNLLLLIWSTLITTTASVTGVETKTKRVKQEDQ